MYVYIFKTGEIEKHMTPPTYDDRVRIRCGSLVVLRCSNDVMIVDGDGCLAELKFCGLPENGDGDYLAHCPNLRCGGGL